MKTCVWIDIDWKNAPSLATTDMRAGSPDMRAWLQAIGRDFATQQDTRFVRCTRLVLVDIEVVKVVSFPILIVDVLIDSGSLVDALIAPEDLPLLEVLKAWVPKHPDWRVSRAGLLPHVTKTQLVGVHRGQFMFAPL